MNLVEIIRNPSRYEFNTQFLRNFESPEVLGIGPDNLILKRQVDGNDMYLGLFQDTKLLSYLSLTHEGEFWRVNRASVEEPYRGHGLGQFLYDYTIVELGLKLMSDATQTIEAALLWGRLNTKGLYSILAYDVVTGQTKSVRQLRNGTLSSRFPGFNHNPRYRIIAMTKKVLPLREALQFSKRLIQWYGAGTSDGNYWNP